MLNAPAIAEALHQHGWWLGRDVIATEMLAALASEAHDWQQQGVMKVAGVGRGATHQHSTLTRSDSIHWLTGDTTAQRQYLAVMDALRAQLNRELFLGLFEFETHFAHYPPGACYQKHHDSFAGAASRVVSVVTYLNERWPADAGGELLVYSADGEQELLRIAPEAGTIIVFLSEKIPHEVLPARRDRYSIAGWFRVNGSSGQRIDLMG